jgi:hypothetical protein
MKPNRMPVVLTLVTALAVPPILAACHDKGPAEKAGEKIDDAARKAKKAVD